MAATQTIPQRAAQSAEATGVAGLNILIADPDPSTRHPCRELISTFAAVPFEANTDEDLLHIMRGNSIDIVLLDLRIACGGDKRSEDQQQAVATFIERLRALRPNAPIIVLTAAGDVALAIEAMRCGASDHLAKPFHSTQLRSALDRAAYRVRLTAHDRSIREKMRARCGSVGLIGETPEMQKLARLIAKVADSDSFALITGEPGTGKELAARIIHANSGDPAAPFIVVDCNGINPAMLDSEIFGHVKGAFPGAVRDKEGLLAAAHGGVLYLDEITALSLEVQAKLLRALNDKRFTPVGGAKHLTLDVRVLGASTHPLEPLVLAGRFRRDLFFKLNVVSIKLPPLRDRKDDVPLLAAHFLDRIARHTGERYEISGNALRMLDEYDWPGNVRELEVCLQRAASVTTGPIIHSVDMPTQIRNAHELAHNPASKEPPDAAALGIVPIAELERRAITEALSKLGGDKDLAAQLLGIGKTTLYRKLRQYNVAARTRSA